MSQEPANAGDLTNQSPGWFGALLSFAGERLLRFFQTVQRITAFTLIILGVLVTKWGTSRRVVWPQIRAQIARAGVALLPSVTLVGLALGFVIIGQTVSLLTRLGATNLSGVLMVTVVIRELGPLSAALLVLGRVGTATVIELGTARALGEIEALEALGIDPIHFLVIPRIVGLVVAVSSLTVYLILISLVGGYLFAFLQNLPMTPGDYVGQIAKALHWQDFLLLAIKTAMYGLLISLIICYQGLAQPLRLEDVARATTRTVAQAVVGCIIIDAAFIAAYIVL